MLVVRVDDAVRLGVLGRELIDAALEAMSSGLADKPWCCDGKYSLADIATGCALSYLDFRFPDIDWRSRHANLARIADKLLSRPTFVDTTPVVRP